MSREQVESFNLPNSSAPVIKLLYRCVQGHDEYQEPECDHVCGRCNYQFKMVLVEGLPPVKVKKKRVKNETEHKPVAVAEPVLAPVEQHQVKMPVELSKKTYTVVDFEGGVKVRSEYVDPEWNIELWLPQEGKWRWLGNWDQSGGLFFMKRWSKHLHRVLNAWGVSDYVMEFLEPQGLKMLVLFVEDTKQVFESSLENLRDHGKWNGQKQGGFDRQCFLELSRWKQKKAHR